MKPQVASVIDTIPSPPQWPEGRISSRHALCTPDDYTQVEQAADGDPAGTIVTIPVCTMASCQQHDACMDRWDFRTKEGDCR